MVCSNYDPDPRKNVGKNGMARRVDDNSSIIFIYHLPTINKHFKEKGEGWVCRRKTIVLYVGCIQNFKNRKLQYKVSTSYG